MSLENAKVNLKEFGKELNLEGLNFDENHTCILGIDNTFSLHLTYEPNSDRLYLYSPILDGLPKDDKAIIDGELISALSITLAFSQIIASSLINTSPLTLALS